MSIFDDKSSTKYGDYKGTIQLDGHMGGSVQDIFRKHFPDSNYFPIAFQLAFYETHRAKPDRAGYGTIYAVSKEEAGESFEEVSSYLQRNQGKIKVQKFEVDFSLSDLGKYFKRINLFVAQNSLSNLIREFEETEEQ